jgi:hypothetical protein
MTESVIIVLALLAAFLDVIAAFVNLYESTKMVRNHKHRLNSRSCIKRTRNP